MLLRDCSSDGTNQWPHAALFLLASHCRKADVASQRTRAFLKDGYSLSGMGTNMETSAPILNWWSLNSTPLFQGFYEQDEMNRITTLAKEKKLNDST